MIKEARKHIQILRDRIYFARLLVLHRRGSGAIARWQREHVPKLIVNAAEHIPAYGALLRERGIDARSIRSIEDFPKLPIISKRFFVGKPVEEYTDPARVAGGTWFKTSGTSGEPLSLLLNPLANNRYYRDSTCYRFLIWDGGFARLNTSKIVKIDLLSPRQKNTYFISLERLRKDPAAALKEIIAYKPDVLASYTSIVLDVARYVQQHPECALKIRYAVTYGEMLYPEARKQISEALGAEVYNRYGMGEMGGAIAMECRYHDGMHITSEIALVEIVDEEGRPVPAGTEGRVIVTDLLNYGMPFIRYETGDRGRMSFEQCPCGLSGPRIWLEGRYSAYLTFGGERIHHLEFDAALDGYMNVIVQFHIIKTSEKSLIVEIVPGSLFTDTYGAKIREAIQAVVGDGITVDLKTVESIARSPRGKSRIVSDHSPART